MSKLKELGKRKKKTYTINGVELEFEALGAKELLQFDLDPDNPSKVQAEETIKLLKYCLKKAVPDATDEEIENSLHTGSLQKIQEAIFDVNELGEQQAKASRAKEMVERRKKALEESQQK